MPRLNIIGIAGPARAGKTTSAMYLAQILGGYVYGFADPLRKMLRAIGVDMDTEQIKRLKETPLALFEKSPREMMQSLGTEWGRNLVHPDLWVRLAHRHFKRYGAPMVIHDVRFENEAAWIRQHGVIIHLSRPDCQAVNPHSSEAGITKAEEDYSVVNDDTLELLQVKLLTVVAPPL